MKKLICMAALCAGMGAQAQSYDADAVNAHCAAEWADDLQMQKFCRDQNTTGFETYLPLRKRAGTDSTPTITAMDNCEAEWLPVWQMVSFCAQQQFEGVGKLQSTLNELPDDVSETVSRKCATDWPDNFQMQAFCADQQATAWRDLQ